MKTIENLSYVLKSGQRQYTIEVFDSETQQSLIVSLPTGRYDKATIVNEFIRSRYSQDKVEAIVNNHFINIAEWIDKKFAGSIEKFEDPEYEEFQEWRAISKALADEIIESISKQ